MVNVKTKIWVSAGVFILSGVQIGMPDANNLLPSVDYSGALAAASQSQGGEGGEGGEGGAEEKKMLSPAEQEVEFLKNLALVEGHLIVGAELYRTGAFDAAKTHMKHPGDELYQSLQAHFKQYRVAGFAKQLQRITEAVEQKRPAVEVDAALRDVVVEIDAARGRMRPDLKKNLLVVSKVMHQAAEEYDDGVKNGKVVEAHEYQDAYGFFTVSKRLLTTLQPNNAARKAALDESQQALKDLDGTWPSLTSDMPGKADGSLLHAAASKIELAASSL